MKRRNNTNLLKWQSPKVGELRPEILPIGKYLIYKICRNAMIQWQMLTINWHKARNKSRSSPKEMYYDNNPIQSWSESKANGSWEPKHLSTKWRSYFLLQHFALLKKVLHIPNWLQQLLFVLFDSNQWEERLPAYCCAYYMEHTVLVDPKKINAKRIPT